jgi:threonine dehydrogenase-like Zn-dependent dehydrogenase
VRGRLAVMTAYGKPFELREYVVPDPEPGAILVRITQAGICGSDLHHWRGDTAGGRPIPPEGRWMGHEGTGVVASVGSGVAADALGNPLREGDRVVFSAVFSCSRCQLCLEGYPNLCVRYPYRPVNQHPFFVGTYADYFYLPPRHPVFLVPDSLPDEVLVSVNCAMCTVANGLYVAGTRQGQSIVIQGAGGLGLMATALAKDLGADRVIVLDRIQNRLELANEFGATDTVDVGRFDTAEARISRVRELTRGLGAHVVMELVGIPELLPEGVAMLRSGGTFLELGMIYSKTVVFDPSSVMQTGKRIVGVHMYPPATMPIAIDFLLRSVNRLPFHRLASNRFPLADVNEAFSAADWGRSSTDVVRGVLVP